MVSPWGFVHMGSPGVAGLLVVYKAWVSHVCLLLDTPFGRRSVGGGENISKFIKLVDFLEDFWFGSHIC